MGNTTSCEGNRYYGFFECSYCGHRWGSGRSWENTYQKCRGCAHNVYPYKQAPLAPIDGSKVKPHLAELCELCQSFGRPCTDVPVVKSPDSIIVNILTFVGQMILYVLWFFLFLLLAIIVRINMHE